MSVYTIPMHRVDFFLMISDLEHHVALNSGHIILIQNQAVFKSFILLHNAACLAITYQRPSWNVRNNLKAA